MSLEELRQRIQVGKDGCWLWQGSKDRHGYGRASHDGKTWLAHRLAYSLTVGPIPEGMCLHHHCRTPGCANPLHLELVTRLENTLRNVSPPSCNRRKTRCDHGHTFDEANTYRHGGRRQCRACNRVAVGRYKARQRMVAAQLNLFEVRCQ